MPPKEPVKKIPPAIARQPISESSLVLLPDDVIEGFEERIETGIDWTHEALARRYHQTNCLREDIPTTSFSEALQNRIKKSILNGFLDENSTISLEEQWEILLPMTQWDIDRFTNEEGKICFNSVNCITDNLKTVIKKAVTAGDRERLMKEFKEVLTLRIFDSEMTELDSGLAEFTKLVTLNLCGNYIGDVAAAFLPQGLKILELQANRITGTETFAEHLPPTLLYLGLARNLLTSASLQGLPRLPRVITTLDLSENDIYDLDMVLEGLGTLPYLKALSLAGNPCSVCMGYSPITTMKLPKLQWLDSREILPTDRPEDSFDPHTDDYRSNYFNFTVIRIMSVPQPPKPEKGATTSFHVELELPLLDSKRRNFLMFRRNESLREMLPVPEDELGDPFGLPILPSIAGPSRTGLGTDIETVSHDSDIYTHLEPKESREILNYTVFESNRVQWNKLMNFQEPTVRIFCPDLITLRDTFQTTVTLRLVYTVTSGKQAKPDKARRSAMTLKPPPGEYRVVLATVRCALKLPDWSQPFQHFHWDDSLGTNDAIHWGDGDLTAIQYSLTPPKTAKGKPEGDSSAKQAFPENLTCHFSFGIDTIRF